MSNARVLPLAIWVSLLILGAVIIVHTPFRTDMGAFLPRSAPLGEQVLTAQVSSGAASHLILLGIEGAPTPVLAAISEAMATQLRQSPGFIDVLNGDAASFAGAQDFIWRNRFVLSAGVTADSFTAAGLHSALTNDLSLLGSDLAPMVQQSLSADPTGMMISLLAPFGHSAGPAVQNNAWVSADGADGADGDRALLLVHTAAPGFDIDAQARDLAIINIAFAQAAAALPGAVSAHLLESGPGVFAVRTRDRTKREVTLLSFFAMTGAVGLLAFAYRSPLVVVLGILPVATGAIVAIAVVSRAFGFVHGVTLGFGVTLIGESIDYAIYLFTQTESGEGAADTLARIWPTLRLGVATSVVGFTAMLFSNFTGFAQLGLFSIAGLIAAAATTRFILPTLVPRNFFGFGAEILARPLLAVMARRDRLKLAVPSAALAGLLALATHHGGFWDDDITALSPIPAQVQALDASLRHDLGVPDQRYLAVLQAGDEQQALAASEALGITLTSLIASGRLGGFDLPSAILPSEATQRARQAAIPDGATLQANLNQAATGLPFRPGIFAPFLADAATAKTAAPVTSAGLPPALGLQLGAMLVHRPAGWDIILPLHDVRDPAAVAAALRNAGPPGVAFVDVDQQSAQLLHGFQHEAVTLAVVGSTAILVLLLAGLRGLARTVRVAAPLAAAVIVTAALLTLGGAKLSIFEVVGFLLIVAVGSNYCLFFERSPAGGAMWRRTVASIVLANLCTVSAYGLMSLSTIPVLHDIGKTVAIGTFLSLCFAALVSARAPAGSPG
jgi:predicted exporter